MHFAGAETSSAESMFNLDLCYELDIGTVANQSEAAKYYNDAAAYNHPDVLYNLGIFHAQGKAGSPININIARNYFIRAAELDRVKEKRALNYLKKRSKIAKRENYRERIRCAFNGHRFKFSRL
ncbi:hypothetical protein HN011_005223 [Eciton burchellii]|nr:hypothetical protein HN011_005223 [Eciton burchellii]